MEVAVDIFNHALKSAQQAKVLRIKLTQKKTACLTLEIVLVSTIFRTVITDSVFYMDWLSVKFQSFLFLFIVDQV